MDKRGAGILLHISSLPGKYGTGDLGEEAYKFVDFLKNSEQHYWQILPLNPVSRNSGFSPYSPLSSMAGNPLLINPEKMLELPFIPPEPLLQEITSSAKADFNAAGSIRWELFEKAYSHFILNADDKWKKKFNLFCEKESFWLNDFALFMACKQKFDFDPWNKWPMEFRLREKKTLEKFAGQQADTIVREKFIQFIFFLQLRELKEYCHNNEISVIGDVPIYIAYDSADVWSNPGIFKLDDKGQMTAIAGVPPDYFDKNGQLWNMPVFNWSSLKSTAYKWWIYRLKQNLELYDIVRLDHFRGFSAYWEVPAGDITARNGKWVPGPSEDFFDTIKKEFPSLPFIAEDLGEIDQPVYDLRDKYGLPGMQVIQFAFTEDVDRSVHIPYNHKINSVVYTGTHDNNTLKGWYKQLTLKEKKLIRNYTGFRINKRNIHSIMMRLVYSSVSRLAIIPIQDILGLGEKAIMNRPSTIKGNWTWKLKNSKYRKYGKQLLEMMKIYGRCTEHL